MVCRNPAVAAERARKREELLAVTEAELEKMRRRGSFLEGSAQRRGRGNQEQELAARVTKPCRRGQARASTPGLRSEGTLGVQNYGCRNVLFTDAPSGIQ